MSVEVKHAYCKAVLAGRFDGTELRPTRLRGDFVNPRYKKTDSGVNPVSLGKRFRPAERDRMDAVAGCRSSWKCLLQFR